MGAPNLQLIVVSLAFAASIGGDSVAGFNSDVPWSRPAPAHRSAISSNQRSPTRKKRTFKYVDHTCESGCIDNWESSDGQEVSLTLACHTSTAREARREMQRMISEGTVVKKGRRYYGHGRRRLQGARTVAIYPRDETGEKPAKIFWYIDGACFSFIETGSLELALDFERSPEFAKHTGW